MHNEETNAVLWGSQGQQNSHGDIASVLAGVATSSFENEDQRIKTLLAAYALCTITVGIRILIGLSQPALGAALKVCKDLELFENWHQAGDHAATADELSKLVPCETALLERLLRHLASSHMLQEPSIGVFEPTPFTKSLLQPVFGEWINHLYDATLPCFFKMPEYLAKTGYQLPLDPADGVFQYTKAWTGDMFNCYEAHPREGQSFNHVMGGVMANQAGWLDIFPHERILETSHDNTSPLVVMVGGNIGYDMERFRQAHPETASRLYLQDRPEVVKLSKCLDAVSKMGYDFFTPQPIKGSRVYYMHGVLHDWDAMTPGYSTLLIHDHIAPRALAHPHTTAYDLTMMVMVAGTERTEGHWEALLADN
ncbi:S-adenosyl-L-methionine-dependent methyltransferase [Aspergillus cavernicola]|uniref:S-adenosyl-L-methionine-dependent methyltransferase n=1 Tax=Aspergillus cavernicola TaxID=176166 RepID=A0ABR4IAU2_9EURO